MFSFYKEPVILKKFITDTECEYLINYDKPMEKNTFGIGSEDDILSFNKKISKNTPMCKKIINKCSNIIKLPHEHFEDLNVVKYNKGGFIKEHMDLKPEKNFRLYTFLICLRDTYQGGETEFPNLNLKFKLKKGDALFFMNVDSSGNMTELSLHEGKVVESGEKWICNIWGHKYPYD